ncbi:3'-5' exonuclease [Nocardia sp. NPDC058499]|uniref:3'-5' exonuclease n=1 Tax=Nocardia sp. NPDC058499 TaxID=3346530 RepID=UPI0036597B87
MRVVDLSTAQLSEHRTIGRAVLERLDTGARYTRTGAGLGPHWRRTHLPDHHTRTLPPARTNTIALATPAPASPATAPPPSPARPTPPADDPATDDPAPETDSATTSAGPASGDGDPALQGWRRLGAELFEPAHLLTVPDPARHPDLAAVLAATGTTAAAQRIRDAFLDGWHEASSIVTAPVWTTLRTHIATTSEVDDAVRRLGYDAQTLSRTREFQQLIADQLNAVPTADLADAALRDARYRHARTGDPLHGLAYEIAADAIDHTRRNWRAPLRSDADIARWRSWAAQELRSDPLLAADLSAAGPARPRVVDAIADTLLAEVTDQLPDLGLDTGEEETAHWLRADIHQHLVPTLDDPDGTDSAFGPTARGWTVPGSGVEVARHRDAWWVVTQDGDRWDCWGRDHRAAVAEALRICGRDEEIRPTDHAVRARVAGIRRALDDRARPHLAANELLHAAARSELMNAPAAPGATVPAAHTSVATREAVRAAVAAITDIEPVLIAEALRLGLAPEPFLRDTAAAEVLTELHQQAQHPATLDEPALFTPQLPGEDLDLDPADPTTVTVTSPDGARTPVSEDRDGWSAPAHETGDTITELTLTAAITRVRTPAQPTTTENVHEPRPTPAVSGADAASTGAEPPRSPTSRPQEAAPTADPAPDGPTPAPEAVSAAAEPAVTDRALGVPCVGLSGIDRAVIRCTTQDMAGNHYGGVLDIDRIAFSIASVQLPKLIGRYGLRQVVAETANVLRADPEIPSRSWPRRSKITEDRTVAAEQLRAAALGHCDTGDYDTALATLYQAQLTDPLWNGAGRDSYPQLLSRIRDERQIAEGGPGPDPYTSEWQPHPFRDAATLRQWRDWATTELAVDPVLGLVEPNSWRTHQGRLADELTDRLIDDLPRRTPDLLTGLRRDDITDWLTADVHHTILPALPSAATSVWTSSTHGWTIGSREVGVHWYTDSWIVEIGPRETRQKQQWGNDHRAARAQALHLAGCADLITADDARIHAAVRTACTAFIDRARAPLHAHEMMHAYARSPVLMPDNLGDAPFSALVYTAIGDVIADIEASEPHLLTALTERAINPQQLLHEALVPDTLQTLHREIAADPQHPAWATDLRPVSYHTILVGDPDGAHVILEQRIQPRLPGQKEGDYCWVDITETYPGIREQVFRDALTHARRELATTPTPPEPTRVAPQIAEPAPDPPTTTPPSPATQPRAPAAPAPDDLLLFEQTSSSPGDHTDSESPSGSAPPPPRPPLEEPATAAPVEWSAIRDTIAADPTVRKAIQRHPYPAHYLARHRGFSEIVDARLSEQRRLSDDHTATIAAHGRASRGGELYEQIAVAALREREQWWEPPFADAEQVGAWRAAAADALYADPVTSTWTGMPLTSARVAPLDEVIEDLISDLPRLLPEANLDISDPDTRAWLIGDVRIHVQPNLPLPDVNRDSGWYKIDLGYSPIPVDPRKPSTRRVLIRPGWELTRDGGQTWEQWGTDRRAALVEARYEHRLLDGDLPGHNAPEVHRRVTAVRAELADYARPLLHGDVRVRAAASSESLWKYSVDRGVSSNALNSALVGDPLDEITAALARSRTDLVHRAHHAGIDIRRYLHQEVAPEVLRELHTDTEMAPSYQVTVGALDRRHIVVTALASDDRTDEQIHPDQLAEAITAAREQLDPAADRGGHFTPANIQSLDQLPSQLTALIDRAAATGWNPGLGYRTLRDDTFVFEVRLHTETDSGTWDLTLAWEHPEQRTYSYSETHSHIRWRRSDGTTEDFHPRQSFATSLIRAHTTPLAWSQISTLTDTRPAPTTERDPDVIDIDAPTYPPPRAATDKASVARSLGWRPATTHLTYDGIPGYELRLTPPSGDHERSLVLTWLLDAATGHYNYDRWRSGTATAAGDLDRGLTLAAVTTLFDDLAAQSDMPTLFDIGGQVSTELAAGDWAQLLPPTPPVQLSPEQQRLLWAGCHGTTLPRIAAALADPDHAIAALFATTTRTPPRPDAAPPNTPWPDSALWEIDVAAQLITIRGLADADTAAVRLTRDDLTAIAYQLPAETRAALTETTDPAVLADLIGRDVLGLTITEPQSEPSPPSPIAAQAIEPRPGQPPTGADQPQPDPLDPGPADGSASQPVPQDATTSGDIFGTPVYPQLWQALRHELTVRDAAADRGSNRAGVEDRELAYHDAVVQRLTIEVDIATGHRTKTGLASQLTRARAALDAHQRLTAIRDAAETAAAPARRQLDEAAADRLGDLLDTAARTAATDGQHTDLVAALDALAVSATDIDAITSALTQVAHAHTSASADTSSAPVDPGQRWQLPTVSPRSLPTKKKLAQMLRTAEEASDSAADRAALDIARTALTSTSWNKYGGTQAQAHQLADTDDRVLVGQDLDRSDIDAKVDAIADLADELERRGYGRVEVAKDHARHPEIRSYLREYAHAYRTRRAETHPQDHTALPLAAGQSAVEPYSPIAAAARAFGYRVEELDDVGNHVLHVARDHDSDRREHRLVWTNPPPGRRPVFRRSLSWSRPLADSDQITRHALPAVVFAQLLLNPDADAADEGSLGSLRAAESHAETVVRLTGDLGPAFLGATSLQRTWRRAQLARAEAELAEDETSAELRTQCDTYRRVLTDLDDQISEFERLLRPHIESETLTFGALTDRQINEFLHGIATNPQGNAGSEDLRPPLAAYLDVAGFSETERDAWLTFVAALSTTPAQLGPGEGTSAPPRPHISAGPAPATPDYDRDAIRELVRAHYAPRWWMTPREQQWINTETTVPADVITWDNDRPQVLYQYVAAGTYCEVTGINSRREPTTARGYLVNSGPLRGGWGSPETVGRITLAEHPTTPTAQRTTIETDPDQARVTILDPPTGMPAGAAAPWLRMPAEHQVLHARPILGLAIDIDQRFVRVQGCNEHHTSEVAWWLFGGRYGEWKPRAFPTFAQDRIDDALAEDRYTPEAVRNQPPARQTGSHTAATAATTNEPASPDDEPATGAETPAEPTPPPTTSDGDTAHSDGTVSVADIAAALARRHPDLRHSAQNEPALSAVSPRWLSALLRHRGYRPFGETTHPSSTWIRVPDVTHATTTIQDVPERASESGYTDRVAAVLTAFAGGPLAGADPQCRARWDGVLDDLAVTAEFNTVELARLRCVIDDEAHRYAHLPTPDRYLSELPALEPLRDRHDSARVQHTVAQYLTRNPHLLFSTSAAATQRRTAREESAAGYRHMAEEAINELDFAAALDRLGVAELTDPLWHTADLDHADLHQRYTELSRETSALIDAAAADPMLTRFATEAPPELYGALGITAAHQALEDQLATPEPDPTLSRRALREIVFHSVPGTGEHETRTLLAGRTAKKAWRAHHGSTLQNLGAGLELDPQYERFTGIIGARDEDTPILGVHAGGQIYPLIHHPSHGGTEVYHSKNQQLIYLGYVGNHPLTEVMTAVREHAARSAAIDADIEARQRAGHPAEYSPLPAPAVYEHRRTYAALPYPVRAVAAAAAATGWSTAVHHRDDQLHLVVENDLDDKHLTVAMAWPVDSLGSHCAPRSGWTSTTYQGTSDTDPRTPELDVVFGLLQQTAVHQDLHRHFADKHAATSARDLPTEDNARRRRRNSDAFDIEYWQTLALTAYADIALSDDPDGARERAAIAETELSHAHHIATARAAVLELLPMRSTTAEGYLDAALDRAIRQLVREGESPAAEEALSEALNTEIVPGDRLDAIDAILDRLRTSSDGATPDEDPSTAPDEPAAVATHEIPDPPAGIDAAATQPAPTPTGSSPAAEPATVAVPEHPIATQILAGEKFAPTAQQAAIYNAVLAGMDVKVQAGAGAGKTSTLEGLSRRIGQVDPRARIVYIAFNRSVREEADERMPANVESRTGHSIAYTWSSRAMQKRSKKTDALRRPDEVARHLGIRRASESAAEQAAAAMAAVDTYATSAEDDISRRHLPPRAREWPAPQQDRVVEYARAAWADLCTENGKLRLTLDHLRKQWALSRPDLTKPGAGLRRPATVLMLDEGQDTPPVLAKVVADQAMRKILVGDQNQAIYGFTGAVDFLDTATADTILPLTVSFRFGPEVASMGNRFLQLLDSPLRIVGGGPASEIIASGTMADPDAILVRSNGGALKEIARELDAGRRVGVPKGTKADLLSVVDTARYLKGEGSRPPQLHDDLATYRTWAEAADQAERGDNAKLNMLVRIVDTNGVDGLEAMVRQVHELGENPLADLTFPETEAGIVAEGRTWNATYAARHLLGRAGFDRRVLPGAGVYKSGKNKGQPIKTWVAEGSAAEREAKMARLRELATIPPPDVVVSTAHKAKGLEWDNVRIGDDFKGPEPDTATGELVMPPEEERRLAYVAVTRAKKKLDLGSLAYVLDHTDPNGGEAPPTTALAQPSPAVTGETHIAPAVEPAPTTGPGPAVPVLSEDQRLLLYAVATSTSGARRLIASLQNSNEDPALLANDLLASLPLAVRSRRPAWEQCVIQVADHQIRLTQRSRHSDVAVTITVEELRAFASSVVLPSPAPSSLDEIDALMHDLLAISAIPPAAEPATHDPGETETPSLGPKIVTPGDDISSDEPTDSLTGPTADPPGGEDDPAPVSVSITAERSTAPSAPGAPLVALEGLADPLLRDNLVLRMVAAAHSAGSAADEPTAGLSPQVASGDQPSIPDERLPITAQSVSAQLNRLGISVRPSTRLDWNGIRVGKYPIKNVVSVRAVHELPSKEKQMAEEAAEALAGQGYYVYRAAGAASMTVSRPAVTTEPDSGAATAAAGPAISPEMLHSPLTRSAAEDVYSALIASAENNALLTTLTTAGIDPLEHLYQQVVPTVLQTLAAETGNTADIADLQVIDPRTVLVGDSGAAHVRLAYAATDTGQLRRWTAQPSQYTRTFDNRSLRAAIERAREVVRNNQHTADAPNTDPAAENPLGLITPYERSAGTDGQLHIVEAVGHHYIIKRRRSGPESLSVWTARPADTDTELGWRTDRPIDTNLGSMDQALTRLREDLAAQAERDAHAEEQQRLFDAAAATTPLFTDLHGTWLPLELLDPVEQYLGALPEADPPGRRLLLALGDRHYLVHQVLTGLQDLSANPPPVYGPHRYEISTAQATTDATDPTAIVAGEHLGTIDTIEVAMPWLRELHRAQVLDEAYEANLSPARATAADIATVTATVAAHWEIRQFSDTHDLTDERIQQAARVLATRLVTAHLNNILLDPDEDARHAQTRALYDHHRGELVDQVLATIVSEDPANQADDAGFATILGTPVTSPVPEALRERLSAEITARDNVLASEDADIPWRRQLRRQRIYTQARIERLNTELGLDPAEWPRSADRAALEREIVGARHDFDSALNDFPELSDNERRAHITALTATEQEDGTDHTNSEGPFTDLEIAIIHCLTDDKAALFNHPVTGGDAARYVAEVALGHLPGRSHAHSYSAIKDIALARIADRGEAILGLTQAQVEQRQQQRRDAAEKLINDAIEAVADKQFDTALSLVDRAELTDPMWSGPGNRSYAFIRERIAALRTDSDDADHAPAESSTDSEPAEDLIEATSDEAPAEIDRSRDWKHPGTITVPSGKRSRARANMTAIEIVQRLNDEDRPATTVEQEQLAQWSGWGAVPEIFDARQADWDNDRERLYGLLDDSGRESALDSILSAYYTDPAIVAAMWSALGSAGFSGGRVLEPGAGTGTFAGLAPASAEMVCVENEPISAKIAHHLYPSALVRLEGFQHTKVPRDFFVATIGNVPFGKFEVRDPVHNPRGHSIHNAFLLKSLALTAPGGYVAVITSPWTMDAENDLARRDMLAVADFVGAVRLPGRAFSRVAGTGAVTDIVILRKRDPSIDISKPDALPAAVSRRNHQFRATQSRTVPDTVTGEPTKLRISKWFIENPGYALGEVSAGGGIQRSGHLNVEHPDLDRLPGDVRAALRKIIVSARVDGLALTARTEDLPENSHPRSGLVIHDPGKKFTSPIGTMRYHEGRFEAVTDYGTWEPVKVYANRSVETRALLRLRDLAQQVVITQRENHEPTERDEARAKLNAEYDAYVRKYGFINRFKWQGGRERTEEERDKRFAELESRWRARHSDHQGNPYLGELPPDIWEEFDEKAWTAQARTKRRLHLEGPISRDPAMAVVRALEVFDEHSGDAVKAPIFTQDVITPVAAVSSADTAEEALSVSMAAGRGADLTFIAQLLGVDEPTAREQLRGQVYRDPDRPDQLQLAPKYLSGDVRQKLARARVAAAADPQYEENVAALEKVIPEWFEAPRITINPSTTWIPAADRVEFARQTFDLPDVKADHTSGRWRFESNRVSARAKEWEAPYWPALALLEALCNSEEIVVAHSAKERENGKPQINMKATAHAQAQAGRIKNEFQRWVWADDERRDRLVKQFNNTLNCWADPQYDGHHLEIPGLRDVVPYFYQRNATMRGLNEPTVMLDHVVGAGKTLTMLMTAWELRRRGMIRQPWIVVPNHLVEEIAIDDVQRWFPSAKVLSAPPGMDNEARRRFIAQTATSDWDFVIVAESVFERIGVKPARLTRYVQDQLAEITEELEDAKADSATRKTIKQIVRDKKQVERRLEKLLEAEKDPGLTLEDTGMDYLCIDEFHRYKNKQRSSPVAELALSPGSKRAENLKIVLQLLVERAGERALMRGLDPDLENMRIATVATGTRIANALAEEWVNQQYLRPDLLEAKGMSSVTEWGSVHTETKSVITTNSSGSKIRAREKVAAYANVRQMIAMTKVFTDIVTREQVPVKLPKLAGGKRLVITTVPGQEVRDFIADLDCRLDDLDPETTWYDNQLKVLNDGRDVALDPQLVGVEVENPEQTRAYVVAREMLIRYHATKNNRYRRPDGSLHPVPGALQIGFSDRGTPDGANRKASLYHAVKRWLVSGIPELDLAGMPEDKIRFIHDARKPSEKRQLISDSNNGHVAVLLGSTEKMGTGMNAQTRAIALHHIDVPWRPADLEQREGRIIRQKNQNDEIEILTYVTEGTVDVMMWSAVEQKSEFIQQARTGNIDFDKIADFAEDDLTHAAALTKAAATGDPRHLRLVELEPIVENLTALDEAHTATRSRASWNLQWLPGDVERRQAIIDSASQHLGAAAAWANEPGIISVGGRTFSERGQANKALLAEARKALLQFDERYKRIHSDSDLSRDIGAIDGHTITATLVTLGVLRLTIGDLPVAAEIDRDRLFANARHGNQPGQTAPPDDAAIARGLAQRIGNAYTGLSERVQILRAKVEADKADLEHAITVVDAPFERADELLAATVELAELRLALQQAKDSPEALAEQEARDQRLAAAGRLRGWSLALNPTKQTVERAGFVTKQQYVTVVREQMAQFAAAYAATGDVASVLDPAPLAPSDPETADSEPDATATEDPKSETAEVETTESQPTTVATVRDPEQDATAYTAADTSAATGDAFPEAPTQAEPGVLTPPATEPGPPQPDQDSTTKPGPNAEPSPAPSSSRTEQQTTTATFDPDERRKRLLPKVSRASATPRI